LEAFPAATDRIRFRLYRPEDIAEVAEMFGDAQARRFYPEMGDPGEVERWVGWNLDNYATHGFGLWVIEHRDESQFLGDCGLTCQPVAGGQWLEVGYHLQRRYRGKGYATEAARACVDYALERLAAERVCSIVDPANTPSIRVASRVHDASRTFLRSSGEIRLLFWSERPGPASPPSAARLPRSC
jgi:RimJ/RimL family protein N-acetyltransferase